jgi:hypothetical protein
MMADTVIFLLRRVAAEMAMERAEAAAAAGAAGAALAPPPPPPPLSAADAAWLPPPLVSGNYAERVEPTCHFGDELPAVVTAAEGFTFLADAEKPGYVTDKPGSVIELSLADTEQSVTISYLRSGKPGMGGAALTCGGGCSCAAQAIDGRAHSDSNSVMVQHHFAVSAARNCTLRLVSEARPPRAEGDNPEDAGAAPGTRFKLMGVTAGGKTALPHSGGLGGEVPMDMNMAFGTHSSEPPPPVSPPPPSAAAAAR